MTRALGLLIVLGTVLAACSGAAAPAPAPLDGEGQASPTPPEATPTAAEPALLPPEPPPSGAASEFSTDFSRHTVPYGEILSGGPPRDGIPAIDRPRFLSVEQADEWLRPMEPVVLVQAGQEARAYPLQVLMWHEIVNDTVGSLPLTVTFCPLCNTAIAFERRLDERVLDFGTTGRLRNSNLIMYDRQTESWWQQASGEAIAGALAGRRLAFYPAAIVSWETFRAAHPGGRVLSTDTGHNRPYGRNPYAGYDDVRSSPFLYRGPRTPDVLLPMARVLTVERGGEAAAYPYETLADVRVVNDEVGATPIVVFWMPGTASALDAGTVAAGRDVGSALAYERTLEGQLLTFAFEAPGWVDAETGSRWDLLGRAVEGPLAGAQLAPVVAVDHFWFSWAAFQPYARLYVP